ncbi:MAG: hypothetical protein Q4C71_00430 [Microbacteriaceae bacterium]|nr:hypothetical protein [Microbacteriaceae bacterium]
MANHSDSPLVQGNRPFPSIATILLSVFVIGLMLVGFYVMAVPFSLPDSPAAALWFAGGIGIEAVAFMLAFWLIPKIGGDKATK